MLPKPKRDISKKTFVIAVAVIFLVVAVELAYFGVKYLGNGNVAETETSTETVTDTTEENTEPVQEWEYIKAADGVKITAYNGDDTRVIIPETFEDTPVVAINGSVFESNTSIIYVEIPSTVYEIGDKAFSGCTALMSVGLPESLKTIGINAFTGCKLLKSVEFPDSVTTVGYAAFAGCESLSSVTVSDGIISFGESVLSGTKWLENAGDGVLYLGNILYGYSGEMPEGYALKVADTTRLIAGGAFADMINLGSVTFPDSLKYICTSAFYGCTDVKNITFPSGIRTIEDGAFCECSSITAVAIPKSVTSIGEAAFLRCDSLTAINVDADNTYYCSVDGALYTKDKKTLHQFCPSSEVTAYEAPEELTSMFSGAFFECEALRSVVFDCSITEIPSYAFMGCVKLTAVTIPDTVESVGEYAFSTCTSLPAFFIPSSLTTIGYGAFSDCSSLESFELRSTSSSFSVEDNVLYNADQTRLLIYPAGSKVTSYELPDTVTAIDSGAFMYANSLERITLPESLETIGQEAFAECSSLVSVNIPDSVTNIGAYCFASCESLKTVTVGSGLHTIGGSAFIDCTSLKTFTVSDSNTMFSSSNGILYDAGKSNLVCYPAARTSTSFTLPDTVTSVASYAFDSCSRIKTIVIPESVVSLGTAAFLGCSSLTAIEVAKENTAYKSVDGVLFDSGEMYLLYYPSGIKQSSYTVPDGVYGIESGAFYDCTNLTELVIPESVENYSADSVFDCTKLTVKCIEGSKAQEYCDYAGIPYEFTEDE